MPGLPHLKASQEEEMREDVFALIQKHKYIQARITCSLLAKPACVLEQPLPCRTGSRAHCSALQASSAQVSVCRTRLQGMPQAPLAEDWMCRRW